MNKGNARRWMRKGLAAMVAFVFMMAPAEPPASARAIPVSAPSVILMDAKTARILYAKTPHRRHPPASTAKILTAVLAVEHLPLDKVVTIPRFVESVEPSKIYLRGGERYRAADLVRAILISSANDAAEALAIAIGGSRKNFSRLMNQKARLLGARRSHFVYGSGLPARGQYSTAYDMALIARYAQRYPFLVEALKTKYAKIHSVAGRRIFLKNHNKMLWRSSREVVGKTGWTQKSRHCFVGHMRVFDKKIFVAILGSHRLWRDLKTLVDSQFGKGLFPIQINRRLWGSSETRKIQAALKRAGFNPGPVDGRFGPRTVRAVEGFQAARGLGVDGIVGRQTWRRLMQA